MAMSEDEVAGLHEANRPRAQVHLRNETTKLIFYSYVECELLFTAERIYEADDCKMCTDKHDWKVKPGVNVICLCRYAECEDWPLWYKRLSISVKTAGQVMFFGHAPDLDSRWQVVILTDNPLFSLQDMLAMKLGLQFMRQEDAVARAREQDNIDHMLTTNRRVLDSWKLSAAQKVLLRHNSSGTRNKSCAKLTRFCHGHYGDSLSQDTPFYKVFDCRFSIDYASRKEWFMAQWVAVLDDPYWKSPDISVPLLDLHDPCDWSPFWE